MASVTFAPGASVGVRSASVRSTRSSRPGAAASATQASRAAAGMATRIGQASPALAGSAASGMFTSASSAKLLAGARAAARQARPSARQTPTRMCGIIGIMKTEGNVSAEIYEGLLMLQHRGQDSAGMVTYEPDYQKFHEHKANGLVKDCFDNKERMASLQGRLGIGHVRYPTAGTSSASEAQPFFVNSPLGIFLIHNGNLTNTESLRVGLTGNDSFFNRHIRTSSDSEVLLNVLADEIHRAQQSCLLEECCDAEADKPQLVMQAVRATMKKAKGAYSVLCMVDGVGLVAFRDPNGIRPLVLGKRTTMKGNEWAVSSEDAAFGPIGFDLVRDVNPGECLIINPEGEMISEQSVQPTLSPCIFEYIYLARPDSTINNISVYNFQLALGRRLAARVGSQGWDDIDVVVPVPDGSRPSAIEVAAELGLPYREGLVKNRYVGRTFIMPDQRLRELSVRRKLNAMSAVFQGKNVLLVDDSIVRGTTMMQIVSMCRAAGAKKVYLAITAPPVKYPNVYGVDMPSRKEFVADGLTEEEVCKTLNADGLLYQSIEDLLAVGNEMNSSIQKFDTSCFTGTYVTGDIDEAYLANLEGESGRGAGERRSGQAVTLV
mmetsp:Transcript_12338/g.39100  ORF Transcript_12338/g.39100 Transcript_12338/m.39100 type:complete len:605 (-) Transcript_12338:51-1865(-)